MRINQFFIKHKESISHYASLLFLLMLTFIVLGVTKGSTDPEPTSTPIATEEPITSGASKPVTTIKRAPPPLLYSEPIAETTPELPQAPRYGFTDDDIYLMAVLLSGSKYVDGDGEFDIDYGRDDEYDQISLVFAVVMNRVRSDEWPDTLYEVIWQDRQFTTMGQWTNGLPEVSSISLQRAKEWCAAYDIYDFGVQTVPEHHVYFTGDGIYNYSR